MRKKTENSEWNNKDSAPMPTKGRKGKDYINQTTTKTENRFPWVTIVVVLLLIAILGFYLSL